MSMIERIPGMDDASLANLHANAQRLHLSGSAQQQTAAADMLPAIQAELAAREARKPPKKTPVRKAAVKAKVEGAAPKPRAAPRKKVAAAEAKAA